MKRILEEFVEKIDGKLSLSGKEILEIGCGTGNYTKQLAEIVGCIEAIDPDKESILEAEGSHIRNTKFSVGNSNPLDFESNTFDVVVFTLSFHHIHKGEMEESIKEAVRVVKKGGWIVFLEPAEDGSFFDAEINFEACDGDERKEKQIAYKSITTSPSLEITKELEDKTVFEFESTDDFIKNLHPHKDIDGLEQFLKDRNMTLEAERRIIICKPKK